jgi:two-component system sensor kinase FixL
MIGTVAVLHDITEHVRAEEEARRRQEELAHVTRLATMGEIATGLAHELNQPLSAILYFARGCGRRLRAGGCGFDEVLEIVEKMAAQAERAAAVVDLNQVVREAADLVAHEACESGVVIDFGLQVPLPPVLVDMIQIEQVVLNVLRNGIEAMQHTEPDRKRLTVQTACSGSDEVLCAIIDAGCGCSEDAAAQLFDSFFTTKPGGMGMGLAISRSIVQAHGGRLWATPNPDGGMTFSFALPVSGSGVMS